MSGISFLFAMFQGGGNLALLLPIAQRLVERGHDVRILAGPSIWAARAPVSARLRERIDEVGATFVPFVQPEIHPLDAASRSGLTHCLEFTDIYGAYTAAYRWAPVWATNVATELARSPADVLVADHLLPGALVAAESREVASAALVHGIYKHRLAPGLPPPGMGFQPARGPLGFARDVFYKAIMRCRFQRDALPSLNHARRKLALSPLCSPFDQFDHAVRVLILCSPEFDFRARHLPGNVRYVGTPLDDAAVPAWHGPWAPDDKRPLVVVSLSTLQQGQGPVLDRILSALKELPIKALVTLGPALDADHFRAPSNVVIVPFAPHSAVLPHASTLITQCGIGGITKALRHGVPLVCIPLVGDQPDNAARVVAHGAGVRLGKDAGPERIRHALHRVLNESRFREAARRLASKLTSEDPTETVVRELESLAPVVSRAPKRSVARHAGPVGGIKSPAAL